MKHLVIIPVYNELPTFKRMLDAYVRHTDHGRCTTVIVDDGSDKKTREYIESLSPKYNFKIIRNNKNLGKTKSINKAIHAYSQFDIFTIIDSDIIIQTKNWNHLLEKAHLIWKRKDILGARLNLKGYEFKNKGMNFGDLFPFWTLPGGFFSIPKSVFKKLGYFYDKIQRHEDAEYCRRAATQNISWYYTPEIKTTILSHRSFADNPKYKLIKKKEESIYKQRSEYIMQTHNVYYNPFIK